MGPRTLTRLRSARRNLKPGGWIEFQEVCPRVGCHDDTMPDDYALARFYRLVEAVFRRKYGWCLFAAEHLPSALERIGFQSVQRKVLHVPIGFWPKEKHRMQHAFLLREIILELIEALQAKPFADLDAEFGLSKEAVQTLVDDVRAALCDKQVHAYIPVHIVWAQKPLHPPS